MKVITLQTDTCSFPGKNFKIDMAGNSFNSIMDEEKQEESPLQRLRAAFEADPQNVDNAIRLIQCLSDQGWYNEALDVARGALENHCDSYTLNLEYGNICFKKKEYKEALKVFSKLTQLKPGRIEGWNNLGIVLVQLAESDRACEAFSKVLQIEGDNPGALVNMGNYYSAKGDLVSARKYFEQAVKARPDFSDAWYNLGNTLLGQKDFENAQISYERALKYQPSFSSAYKNLGYAYEKNGKLDKAEECYRRAIELNKADSSLRVNLGLLYFQQRKYDDAKKCFLKAVKLAPHTLPGWMGLRELALAKGDLNTFIRSTLAVLPKLNEETIARSIEILYELNQIEKAEEILAQADRLGLKGDALDLQRLLIYQRKGVHSSKVASIFKHLSEHSALTDQIRKGLARYALLNKDFETAISHVEKMEKPDSASLSVLWRALLAKNDERKVKQLIHLHIKDDPDYYDSWFILSKIEAARGNRVRAERFLVRALENGFTNMEELKESSLLKQIFDSLTVTGVQKSIDNVIQNN